jgi:hypothetical protein
MECKWSAKDFDPAGLQAFARNYSQARLLAVAADARPAFRREHGGQKVEFMGMNEAISTIAGKG